MANFDEGRVYSAQIYRPNEEGDIGDVQTTVGREEKEQVFRNFITRFERIGGGTYGDRLFQTKSVLEVEIDDLAAFNAKLKQDLVKNPSEHLPLFERAAAGVLRDYMATQTDEQMAKVQEEVHLILHASKKDASIETSARNIMAEKISQLVQVPGIIIGAAKPRAKATYMTIQCKDCKMTTSIAVSPGMGGVSLPRQCTLNRGSLTNNPCSLDSYSVVPQKSKFVDQQTLKLQERPEDVPTGDLPRTMKLVVDRAMVDRVNPGMRVQVLGIHSVYQPASSSKSKDGAGLREPYLRVVGIREDSTISLQGLTVSLDEKQYFEAFSKSPDIHKHICEAIAPEIFGHDKIKQSIACLLFGGSRKKMLDGTCRRGDINVLLLGDPSTAKSQFLKFTSKLAPIAVYTSGKGSSAAGLTAAVIKDNQTREFYLEGGAMVLADNGVVCIDEFDKMRPEDRVAIHEAMEQQTISIAKAGITTMLKSRTSVLAAANPPKGRYDDLKTARENIDLQTTILSRFDLIFIVIDKRDVAIDTRIAKHVLDLHRKAANISLDESRENPPPIQKDGKPNIDFLRRYIHFCKYHCSPRLTAGAAHQLNMAYSELREEARRVSDMGHGMAVPITVRQLEALVRLSESMAKMQLRPDVREEHVQEAIRLFKLSTMDAVKSGIVDGVSFTPEQRSALHGIENQIKQRMALNSCMSEKRLMYALRRGGMEESEIRRAIVMLIQQRDLEFIRDRHILKRVR
ncbi:hypothetical protein BSKO_04961 [Bryopsis sp. KO-2023]|nr:hypothetical protein BSKO_04961 [Bryopsis sp. KO-2023]